LQNWKQTFTPAGQSLICKHDVPAVQSALDVHDSAWSAGPAVLHDRLPKASTSHFCPESQPHCGDRSQIGSTQVTGNMLPSLVLASLVLASWVLGSLVLASLAVLSRGS
jgi:hypothetical protein